MDTANEPDRCRAETVVARESGAAIQSCTTGHDPVRAGSGVHSVIDSVPDGGGGGGGGG